MGTRLCMCMSMKLENCVLWNGQQLQCAVNGIWLGVKSSVKIYPIELWRWWAWRATHVFCHNYNGSMDDCKLEFVVPNFSQLNGYVTSEPTTIHRLPWYVYHHWGIFCEVVYSWTVNYRGFRTLVLRPRPASLQATGSWARPENEAIKFPFFVVWTLKG